LLVVLIILFKVLVLFILRPVKEFVNIKRSLYSLANQFKDLSSKIISITNIFNEFIVKIR